MAMAPAHAKMTMRIYSKWSILKYCPTLKVFAFIIAFMVFAYFLLEFCFLITKYVNYHAYLCTGPFNLIKAQYGPLIKHNNQYGPLRYCRMTSKNTKRSIFCLFFPGAASERNWPWIPDGWPNHPSIHNLGLYNVQCTLCSVHS